MPDPRQASHGDQLLAAVQLAYRKHALMDDRVGWEELEQTLLDTLCNAMGSDGFQDWIAQVEDHVA